MGLLSFFKTQSVAHLLIGFVFVVSGLIINFIQLCTMLIWPINRHLYRRLNCRLAYSLWSQLVMLLEWWSGTECTLFTTQETIDHFGKEHAIIILNHNFEIDFLCGWTMCERFGVLGSSKVLAKKELLKVPLIGWTWYFLEIVFCKRKWEEDRDTVVEGLKNLSDYPEYMWFLLYCEGTRFTETKHHISMEVAESKGLPRLKHHLLPRTKGFTTAVQCLRGTVSAVYDVTLNFKGNKNPSLLGILYGKKYEADMCVRRFALDEVPEDEKEAASWLHKLYQDKYSQPDREYSEACESMPDPCRRTTVTGEINWPDPREIMKGIFEGIGSSDVFHIHDGNRHSCAAYCHRYGIRRRTIPSKERYQDALQDKYFEEGTFPGTQIKPPRRLWSLLNFLFWATILLSPLFASGFGVFASGSPLLILAFLGFVGAASFAIRRLIGVTEIERGSSYGNREMKNK